MRTLLGATLGLSLSASPLLLVGIALAAPAAPRAEAIQVPIEKYVLPNGLEVLLSRDARIPVVHVEVWYHVGSKDEQPGKTGFAHLFEHMMFQGSRNIAEDTWFKRLDAVGGYFINGTTNNDRTNYFESVPSNQLELVLWMESDRMGFLLDRLTAEQLRTQKEVVRNERRQSYEMRPYGMLEKTIVETLYPPGHPYHHTVIGEHEDLARAGVEDVAAFFRKYYVPSNATVAVVGDFDPAQTKRWMEKYFGSLPSGPRPTASPPVTPKGPSAAKIEMSAGVQLARFVFEWHAPRPWDPEEAPLDLLAMVLADGKSSRLYQRLVYELRLAQEVIASDDTRQYGGDFAIDVLVRPGHTIDEVVKIVEQELAKVRAQPIPGPELERAKTKVRARFVRGIETNHGRAARLQAANHYTADPSLVNREIDRYDAVDAATIQKLAQQRLDAGLRLEVTVLPDPKAPLAGQVVGKGKR